MLNIYMSAPSKILLSLELPRSIGECYITLCASPALCQTLPRGDGHTVIVIPGLGADNASTSYLRHFLSSVGYNAIPWDNGRNLGPTDGLDKMVDSIARHVVDQSLQSGTTVTIIGWSLGGIYAREVAKQVPSHVRHVITLGTPFRNLSGCTNAETLYKYLTNGRSYYCANTEAQIAIAPPMSFTSIYSKTDGVVDWQSSLEVGHKNCTNIEIPLASHLGLPHNILAIYSIARDMHQKGQQLLH